MLPGLFFGSLSGRYRYGAGWNMGVFENYEDKYVNQQTNSRPAVRLHLQGVQTSISSAYQIRAILPKMLFAKGHS